MKCYFDVSQDAQGQCQQCGRFACREYSMITNGKFVCIECFYGGAEGMYQWVKDQIEATKTEGCGVCSCPLYEWPDAHEFRFVYRRLLAYEEQRKLEAEYEKRHWSGCSTKCPVCSQHQATVQGIERAEARYNCAVCGESWTDTAPGISIRGVRDDSALIRGVADDTET